MKVKKFPEPLDDPSKLSPELLVLWAKKAVWSTEIKTLKKRIEEFDDESIEADKRLTLEQKEKAEQSASSNSSYSSFMLFVSCLFTDSCDRSAATELYY